MTALKIWDIHGGIHPPEHKDLSNRTPIQPAPLPKRLVLPLTQHLGAPAEPCVTLGEQVLKGQQIAVASGFVSAPLHAPTSGVVSFIGPQPYPHVSGMLANAIVIDSDGEDKWIDLHPQPDYRELERPALLELIRQAGISGLGGAGFPTAVKLSPPPTQTIRTLIINGTECEPYITADDLLMREKAAELVAGIEILAHLIQPQEVLIGIEDNKPEAIAAVRAAIGERPFTLKVFPTKYPSGGEKQLIQILTGEEVPSGGLPADIGMLCQNVGTCVAIHDAVLLGKPLISRITTLTGEALARPMNVEVLIGTPVDELLAFAGLDQHRLNRLIMGGPMMGFSLQSLEVPVVKTTNCLLASTLEELPPPPPALPCIRCGECAEACPVSLLPQQLHFFALGQEHEQLKAHNLFDCIECGACAYVCPSNIPLVQYYRAAKGEIRELEQKQQKAEHSKQRFELRQERLRRAEEQKEAERKARAERAARAKAAQSESGPTATTAETAAPAQKTSLSETQKKLKIEASMAQVALKKAEKQLATHATAELEAQVADLRNAAEAAQRALDAAMQADSTPPATAPGPDDAVAKKAKIEAAMLKAQIRKLEKIEAPDDDQQTELARLRQQLNDAEQALTAAQSAAPAPAAKPADDEALKKAKIEAAMLKAQIRKLEKIEAPDDDQQTELARLRQQLNDAEQALTAAQSAAPAPAAKPADDEALKKAKIEAAMLKAQIRKLEKIEAPDDDQQAELARLRQQLNDAEQTLAAAQSAAPAPAAKPADDEALKKAKIEAAMLKAQIRKLEKIEAPDDDQQAELARLRQQLHEAEQGLSAAQNSAPTPDAKPAADDALKKAKIELAMKRAELKKAEKAGAEEPELSRLRDALSAAEQALHAAEDASQKPAPELVRTSKPGVDDRQRALKTELAFARADLRKLERDENAESAAIDAARARLSEAERQMAEYQDS
ncbi:electron transport complex protein RnfC [Stutzerimonas stutzeri]|uniref:electron transport complex subunit RsxC n=2 Tax=Stutzerimonas stutzeri subgroup TaxID=578833 RepID=UPI000F6F6AC8|nr:electron transport complex subunit RsxC [Stutzerimonas stutzeri]QQC12721.1 electron transport complex subunit RsxC [Stutzerimonas stutzeri]VEI36359.1 electron transport complex protein RnfC [Stutzerimonas stutzeri]